MTWVRFRTGIFFTGEIETQIFSALLTEFKKVLIQGCTTDLTVMRLHLYNPSRPPFTKGRRSGIPPFIKGDEGGLLVSFGYRHTVRTRSRYFSPTVQTS
jgi:hypothetical protein